MPQNYNRQAQIMFECAQIKHIIFNTPINLNVFFSTFNGLLLISYILKFDKTTWRQIFPPHFWSLCQHIKDSSKTLVYIFELHINCIIVTTANKNKVVKPLTQTLSKTLSKMEIFCGLGISNDELSPILKYGNMTFIMIMRQNITFQIIMLS